jgi:hypothetical protein
MLDLLIIFYISRFLPILDFQTSLHCLDPQKTFAHFYSIRLPQAQRLSGKKLEKLSMGFQKNQTRFQNQNLLA